MFRNNTRATKSGGYATDGWMIFLFLALFSFVFSVPALGAFVSTWDTRNTQPPISSDSDQVELPLDEDGDYDFTVDWGDGTIETITEWDQAEVTHTYADEGVYEITITGQIEGWRFDWGGDKLKLLNILSWGPLELGNKGGYFDGCENLTLIQATDVNFSGTTNMEAAFARSGLTDVPDINNWDVSEVTDMNKMFWQAHDFNEDIGDWDVSSVTDMSDMFSSATDFNQDIGDWDVSEVQDMNRMFWRANAFDQDIGGWDVEEVTDMTNMFRETNVFNQDIGGWDVSNVENMSEMFRNAGAFNQDIGGWEVGSVTNMFQMFRSALVFNQDIGGWDVSSVTNMAGMFQDFGEDDIPFDQDLGDWDVSNVEDMENMFENVKLSTHNYNSLLTGWEALDLEDDVVFDGGDSRYSWGAAGQNAREDIMDDHNWTITDDGLAEAYEFRFDSIGTQTAGVEFTVFITAVDDAGNRAGEYEETAELSDSTGSLYVGLDDGDDDIDFDEGEWDGEVTITIADDDVFISAEENITGTSGIFIVEPADPDGLIFVQQPSRTEALEPIAPTVAVQIIDEFENEVPEENVTITLSFSGGDPAAVIDGNEEDTDQDGLAEFGNLTIDRRGADYYFTAGAAGVDDEDSDEFDIYEVYTLTVNIDGEGEVEVDGDVHHHGDTTDVEVVDPADDAVDLEAIPATSPDWVFRWWENFDDDPQRILELDSDTTITATFVTYLQGRLDDADPGDTVWIDAGDYTAADPIVIGENLDGDPLTGLTMVSIDGKHNTTIDAEDGNFAVIIEADDVTFEGFWIADFTEAGVLIEGDGAKVGDNIVDAAGSEFGIWVDEDVFDTVIYANSIENAVERGIGVDLDTQNTVILNNRIVGNEIGIENEPPAIDVIAAHNHIVGNMEGVVWSGENLLAVHNWWGDGSGPSGEGPGAGDSISDNVDSGPWIGNEDYDPWWAFEDRGTFARYDSPLSDDFRQGFAAETDGGVLSPARLDSNVTGVEFDHDANTSYTHLFVARGSDTVDEITLRIFYIEPSDRVVHWFDGSEWEEASDQSVVTAADPAYPVDYVDFDGYVEVRIDAGTTPSMADFSGAVFGIGSVPITKDRDITRVSGGGSSDCFIATAAFGSSHSAHVQVLRSFRDRYLRTNRVGRSFVDFYYSRGPHLASLIEERPVLRLTAVAALLPVVAVAYAFTGGYAAYLALVFAAALLMFLSVKNVKRQLVKSGPLMLAVAVIALTPGVSNAARVDHFEIAPGEEKTAVVPTTGTVEKRNAAFDLFYSYARKPLEGVVGTASADLVKSRHTAQTSVTYGLSEEIQVSLRTPYVMKQRSDLNEVKTRGFGDTVLSAKYRLPGELNGLRLAVAPYYRFNTGRNEAFMSGEHPSAGLRLISDKRVSEHVLAAVNVGYEYQSKERLAQIDIEHSFLYGAAVAVQMPDTPIHFSGEIYGRSERLDSSRRSPSEALLSAGYDLGVATLSGGLARSLNNGYGASSWRFFTGLRMGF